MKFTKMHGCGNDGVFLDALADPRCAEQAADPRWPALVRRICDRHAGIGADFVVLLDRAAADTGAAGAAARMRVFNADGTQAQMCSTGIRGAARLLVERHGFAADGLHIETGRGVLKVVPRTDDHTGRVIAATVSMGAPILDPKLIPTRLTTGNTAIGVQMPDNLLRLSSTYGSGAAIDPTISCVSMGNPHAVVWCADPDRIDLARVGPRFEVHEAFPERVNAHFARVVSRTQLSVRHWERGCGPTLACGTGSCAVVVAGVLTRRIDRRVDVRVPGGAFQIEWPSDDSPVMLTGPIEEVFDGAIPRAWFAEPAIASEPRARTEPTLTTDRFILRPFDLADVDAIVNHLRDGAIARTTLLIPHPYTVQDGRKWIVGLRAKHQSGESIVFAVCEKNPAAPSAPIGAIGLRIDSANKKAELGYWIAQPNWNQGVATEVGRAVLAHAFQALGLDRVHASHFTGNESSGRVMEKIGMTPEGLSRRHVVKRGVSMDCVLYGITREQWGAARPQDAAPSIARRKALQ